MNKEKLPEANFRYYANGQCNLATKEGAYAYVKIQDGSIVNVTMNKVDDVNAPRIQMMAVIKAARNVPEGSSAIIFTNDKYTLNAFTKGGETNKDLLKLYAESVEQKTIHLVHCPNNEENSMMKMAQDNAKNLLYGFLLKKRVLSTVEYAFLKGLQKLLIDFNATVDGATFDLSGKEIELPRCSALEVIHATENLRMRQENK